MVVKISLERAIAQYLLDSENEGQSPATLKKKRKFFKRLLKFGFSKEYSEQLLQDFLQLFREQGLAANSIRTYGVMLRAFSNWMAENGHAKKFSKKLKIPQEQPKDINLLSLKKAEAVIIAGTTPGKYDNASTRKKKLEEERPALQFVLRTGIRIHELCGLRGCDLKLDDQSPKIKIMDSKSGRIEFVPAPVDMVGFLRDRIHRTIVFEVSEEVLRIALKRGCLATSVAPIGVHDLRHACATNLLRRGMPLQKVSRLLRHKSVLVTDRYYSHYIIEDLAVEMNTKNELIRASITDDDMANFARKQLLDAGIDINNIHVDLKTKSGSFSW